MTEQEEQLVSIVGSNDLYSLDHLRNSRNYGHNQYVMIDGLQQAAIHGLRHKETGDIVIPSMYYPLVTIQHTSYWDSSDEKMYAQKIYIIQENGYHHRNLELWLKSNGRNALSHYEIVAIMMKDGKYMPYKDGYSYFTPTEKNHSQGRYTGGQINMYDGGIAGLPRSIYNDIETIHVLQETYGKSDDAYEELLEQDKIEFKTPKEI
tara:strand:- start:5050 stop:5667 length:618 start_codon:yes stop_codon:yes gene_type:complete